MPGPFPIYWRKASNEWGTALTRGLPVRDASEPTLAEFVTECPKFEQCGARESLWADAERRGAGGRGLS